MIDHACAVYAPLGLMLTHRGALTEGRKDGDCRLVLSLRSPKEANQGQRQWGSQSLKQSQQVGANVVMKLEIRGGHHAVLTWFGLETLFTQAVA